MCFWFGLEIVRLVYKKVFFEILNGFYLIWPFILRRKVALPLIRVEKNFFEIGHAGYQKKRNFALILKMCRTLASRSSQRFFLRKQFFAKFSKSLKIKFFCKIFFPFCQTWDFSTFLKSAQNSASFDTLHIQFWRNFFLSLIRGYFIRRIKGQIR